MTTLNQTGLGELLFRRSKMIRQAITVIQTLTVILAAHWATAQPSPVAASTNLAVSNEDVTVFMRSFQKDPAASFKISTNPKRVPLLLAATQREPAGPWVHFLQGFCFGSEHATAWRLPSSERSEVYSQAIEYLTAARSTVAKAFAAEPQNRGLKDNLGTLDAGLALAYVESGTRAKEVLTIAEALLASNTVTNWNYGNLTYDMHSLLGRIALREGDVAGAKRQLAASGKTPGSPQLDSFGPDFVLARELLQRGEQAVVIEHLDNVALFWANPDNRSSLTKEHQKKIAAWKETIRAGRNPDDHQWQAARVPSVDSTPVDETALRNARRQACVKQLNQIVAAKQTWALDKAKEEGATPTLADLTSYLEGGKPRNCPDGGSYVIGKISENPRCSVPGHELPKRPN